MTATRKKRRRFPWFLLVLAALALGVFLLQRRPVPLPHIQVERVASGTFTREVTGSGQVIPSRERTITFRAAGTVATVPVNEGDRVTAGTLLATLDTTALERDLAANRSRLESARADLERSRAQERMDRLDVSSQVTGTQDELNASQHAETTARSQLETIGQLFNAGAASGDELRNAEDTLDRAVSSTGQARREVEQARTRNDTFAQLAQANIASATTQITTLETTIAGLEEELAEAELRAPFPGVITSLDYQPGSATTGQGSITLVDTQDLVVSASFNENRAAGLQADQRATVTPDSDTNLRLPATVERVAAAATRANNLAQIEARLAFSGEAFALLEEGVVRPGFSVTVRIEANRLENVLLVPLEAISEEAGESFVFTLTPLEDGSGTVSRETLTILDRNATFAAAKSEELAAGELLAVLNVEQLEDGMTVSFSEL